MTQYRPFRKQRSYLLPIVIILVAIWLSFNLPTLRSTLTAVAYPFQAVTSLVWKTTVSIPAAFVDLWSLGKTNHELKEQLASAEAKLTLCDELDQENKRLRSALGFADSGRFSIRLLPAAIIGRGGATDLSILEINKGTGAGVRVNLPVVCRSGLVGTVIEASQFSAKVLMITDLTSSVSAVDQVTRDFGVVIGQSPRRLLMKYVSNGEKMKVGDTVVTSAVSSLFPGGLPVGKVVKISKSETDLFYDVTLAPAVDFSTLEEVFVVI